MDGTFIRSTIHSLTNSTAHALRHPLCRAPLPLRPAYGGLASPPFQSGVGHLPRKNPSVDFSWDCRIALHFCTLLTRLPKKNPSVDFSWDCRSALHFCTLLSRPPWLDIPWQERNTSPEPAKANIHKKKHLLNSRVLRHIAKR